MEAEAKQTQLVGAKELAKILSLHVKTVQRHARRGIIPAVRVGGVWRFDPTAFRESLHSK
jgi:excisionase family DNA binding protein